MAKVERRRVEAAAAAAKEIEVVVVAWSCRAQSLRHSSIELSKHHGTEKLGLCLCIVAGWLVWMD